MAPKSANAVPPKATTNGSLDHTKEDSPSTEISTPPTSRVNSVGSDLNELGSTKTLASRSKIPISMYIVALLVVGAQFSGGVYSKEVLQSLGHSLVTSAYEAKRACEYLRDLMQATAMGQTRDVREIIMATLATLFVASTLYVLIYVPLRAGMWTGHRARRHKIHRYMGLSFLLMYFAAWIEFIVNYDTGGKDSYLSHFIGLTGVIQGVSAYFSFKVLPELADPGYYSDKAVLSRTFIHENTYFSTITFLGSCLYHDTIRAKMMDHPIGRVIMFVFAYWLYVIIRPFFPITSFSNAGSSMAGRSSRNEAFYRIGTTLVKIFYLWGKYFLGFFVNWMCYLGIGTDKDMRFIRGLYLMNVGTVSISVFLHTLRFKKALPPTLAFSIYLGQIYGTFLALPYCYDLFLGHKQLLALTIFGLAVNMTRNRNLHAVWCGLCVYLLEFSDIEW